MKKLLKLPMLLSVIVVSGCATMEADEARMKSQSEMSAKRTVDQSVLETVEEINGQLILLEKLSRGIELPKPPVVVHNQNLQEKYIVPPVVKAPPKVTIVKETTTTTTSMPLVSVDPVAHVHVIPSEFNKKAKIQWHNKSLNTILGGIASAVKYDFVVVPNGSIKDQNINFNVNNEPLIVVLKNIATVVDSFANIELSHKDKVIKVVYK